MQHFEIASRHVIATACLGVAAYALYSHTFVGTGVSLLAAGLVSPLLDPLLSRVFPEDSDSQAASAAGQSVLRAVGSVLLLCVRLALVIGLPLWSLALCRASGNLAELRIEHAPGIEFQDQVVLNGMLSGINPHLYLNGQEISISAGRFITRQPLAMGINTFQVVLDAQEGPAGERARKLQKTLQVRRVSEAEYDQQSFGKSDENSLDGATFHRHGMWLDTTASEPAVFAGDAEVQIATLHGRFTHELTAPHKPLAAEAAELELTATVKRGRVKVLLKNRQGQLESRLVTPEQPLHLKGSSQLALLKSTVTLVNPAAEGTPPAPTIEELWVAHVTLAALDEKAEGLTVKAHYSLK